MDIIFTMLPYYLVLPVYEQGLVMWSLPGGRGQGKHQEQRHREEEICKIQGQWAVGGYWPWCWSGSCTVERSPGFWVGGQGRQGMALRSDVLSHRHWGMWHLGNHQMLANPSRGLDVLGLDTCTLKGLWSTLWGGQLFTGFGLHLDVGSMTGTQDALPG